LEREHPRIFPSLGISVQLNRVAKILLKKYLTNSEISLRDIIKKTNGFRIPILKSYTPTLLYGLNSKDKIENWELISTIAENQRSNSGRQNRTTDVTHLDFTSKDKNEKTKIRFNIRGFGI